MTFLPIVLLVLATGFETAVSIKCMECADMPDPQDCTVTTECSAYETCHVTQYITTGGLVLYKSGCMAKTRCGVTKRDVPEVLAKRQDLVSSTDIVTCVACCDTEFCNLEGCGITGLKQPKRGPVCFSCDTQSDPNNCRDVLTCSDTQVCSLFQHFIGNQVVYTSKCDEKRRCQAFASIGRRGLEDRSSLCYKCCTDDFCNHDCGPSAHLTTALPSPTTPVNTTPKPVITTKATPKPTQGTPKPTQSTPKPTQATPKPTQATPKPTQSATQATPKPTHATPKPTHATPKPTHATPKPTQATPKPTHATPKPTHATPKPTQATPKPTHATPKPTHATPKPTHATPKPTQATPKPTHATPKPTHATPKPTQATPKPTQATPKPTHATPKPTHATPKPTHATPKPTHATPKPTLATHKATQSTTTKSTSPPPTTTALPTTTKDPETNCKKDNYIFDSHLNLCLKFHTTPTLNWTNALHACESDNGTLAVITSPAKAKDVQQFIASHSQHAGLAYWVGANDKTQAHVFTWLNGDTTVFQGNDTVDWSQANCLFIDGPTTNDLKYESCTQLHAYICEKKNQIRTRSI